MEGSLFQGSQSDEEIHRKDLHQVSRGFLLHDLLGSPRSEDQNQSDDHGHADDHLRGWDRGPLCFGVVVDEALGKVYLSDPHSPGIDGSMGACKPWWIP